MTQFIWEIAAVIVALLGGGAWMFRKGVKSRKAREAAATLKWLQDKQEIERDVETNFSDDDLIDATTRGSVRKPKP